MKRSPSGYRSLPHKHAYLAAAVLAGIHYLSLLASLVLGGFLFRYGAPEVRIALFIALGVMVVSWLLGFIHRANAKCPLCRGTPLLDNSATKHRDSYRLGPLNYGSTAQLGLVFLQRFRCMYCGTGFDLMRKSSSLRNSGQDRL